MSPGLGRTCVLTAMVVVLGLAGSGCATCKFPRLDPTGERIFAPADAPPPGAMPVPGAAALTNPTSAAGTVPAFQGIGPPPGVAHIPSGAGERPAGVGSHPRWSRWSLGPPVPVGPGMGPQPGLSLSPAQIVAPVGSEVVLVARVLGSQGYLLTRERIEWSMNAGEQGQFVAVGAGGCLDPNRLHGLPKKVANTYVINATSTPDQARSGNADAV